MTEYKNPAGDKDLPFKRDSLVESLEKQEALLGFITQSFYCDPKSVEELKALKPQISAKGKAFVKANPGCTRKEAAANGCKNITKEGLKALKRELGVR